MTNPQTIELWQETLLREWYHCPDEDYAGRLWKLIALPESVVDQTALSETERPHTFDIEAALRRGCRRQGRATYGWEKRLTRLDRARQRPPFLSALLVDLRAHHWFDRFIAHHLLIPHGSQAIDPLLDLVRTTIVDMLYETALWLLDSIGAETTARLAAEAETLLCPTCVVHCAPLEITIAEDIASIPYYGCRACGQTLTFEPRLSKIVAVLDEGWAEQHLKTDEVWRVNWLHQDRLFDFDEVEIIRATDETAERFAMRVGNDTDTFRAGRYATMRCRLDPACGLSANTPRVLAQVFGNVEAL